MALKKTKTLSDGQTGEYWRFSSINFTEVIDGEISSRYDLTLWKDQVTKDTEGMIPMIGKGAQYNYSTDTDLNSITVADLGLDITASVKDVIKKALYSDLKIKAIAEAAKDPAEEGVTVDEKLKYFSDAIDVL